MLKKGRLANIFSVILLFRNNFVTFAKSLRNSLFSTFCNDINVRNKIVVYIFH